MTPDDEPTIHPMRVLSLGAGEQSSAIFLLAATDEIPALDYAIFADTGEEPAWVYDQVKELKAFPGGCPILIRWLKDDDGSQVRLGDNCLVGQGGKLFEITGYSFHLLVTCRRG